MRGCISLRMRRARRFVVSRLPFYPEYHTLLMAFCLVATLLSVRPSWDVPSSVIHSLSGSSSLLPFHVRLLPVLSDLYSSIFCRCDSSNTSNTRDGTGRLHQGSSSSLSPFSTRLNLIPFAPFASHHPSDKDASPPSNPLDLPHLASNDISCRSRLATSLSASSLHSADSFPSASPLAQEHGLHGFFSGVSLRIVRKGASSAIGWSVYEGLLLSFRDRSEAKKRREGEGGGGI